MATKNLYYIIGATAALLLITMSNKKPFSKITDLFKFRGTDPLGSGAFGASRNGGTRKHNGVDVIATPGQAILAPITGKVIRLAYPYSDDLSYKGLLIENAEYSVKMFYINPTIAVGSQVKAGEQIATAQNISAKWGAAMQNHVHFEVYDKKGNLLNPTNMFAV